MNGSDTDFARFVALQSALIQADNSLTTLDAAVNPRVAEIVDATLIQWSLAKSQRDEAEREIKALIERHPEWLDGKSIKTPYGTVSTRKITQLDIPNPEATLALIRISFPKANLNPEQFIRKIEEPRLELLETLPADQLASVGITVTHTTNITVKPQKVDMAAEAKPKRAKAAKA